MGYGGEMKTKAIKVPIEDKTFAKEAQLREIGVTSAIELDEDVDTYIVNYATGEVMNETQADKMVLYVYAVDLR